MNKLFSNKVRAILVCAVLLAAIIIGVSAISSASTGTGFVQTLLSPFRAAGSALVRQAERYYDYVFRYESLLAENEELQTRIMAMEDEVRSADSLQRENERLRQLLKLSEEHEDYTHVSAYVISWNSSNWKSAFTIGKGTDAGVCEGMVAITEFGQVVGLVTQAGANWATVTSVLDSSLEISACVASTGYNGIVEGSFATGDEGLLRMKYLPSDAVLRNNDQIVTTGSTVYPRGLILGYITDAGFDATGVAKFAVLEPAADLDDLEQVFIITDFENN